MARGCAHPYRNTVIDGVIAHNLIPSFIHEATKDELPLADEIAVYDHLLEVVLKHSNRTDAPRRDAKDQLK